MQMKFSYRVLKWTLLVGTAASLATACVVTTGDGSDISDGGDGGSLSASGKTSTAGTTSTSGKTSTAGTGGTTSTAGTTAGGTEAAGGEPSTYVPGKCDSDVTDAEGVMPTMLPSCAPAANDTGQDCKICLKNKCCDAWKNCYGDTPTTACGWGTTEEAPGQYDCIIGCFADNKTGEATAEDLLAVCASDCTNQCDQDAGNVTAATSNLIACANDADTCQAECFPFK